MSVSDRSMITLRLLGASFPDGEIPLTNLARIAERAQRLATRLARAEENRGGPGRSPQRIEEGVRLLFVGIEPGSTQLLIAGPPREPQFDLGAASEEVIERTFGELIDGLEASAEHRELPARYDDLARRGLVELLDALGETSPEVEAEGRVGARSPKHIRFRPADARAGLEEPSSVPPAPQPVAVEGLLYAVNLRTGHYRIEDDIGSSIGLVTSLFTSEQVAPLLGQRVRAEGEPHFDDAGRLQSVDVSALRSAPDLEGLDAERFWHNVELEELLAPAEPLPSLDVLRIPDLTTEEGDAFLRAISE